MIWGCIPFKAHERLCLVNGNVNTDKYVSNLENILISSLEDQFEDSDFIFMDKNSSYYRSRTVKNILFKNNVPQMELSACNLDINPIENIWYI